MSQFHVADGTLTPDRGPVVTLRPQSAAVLRVLFEQRGKIVSRDDLMTEIWPTTTVTEDSVTRCIREIRAALGHEGHRLLRTFPKRGYMLELAPEASSHSTPPALRWPILLAGLWLCTIALIAVTWPHAPVGGNRPEIVVQPFLDIYQTEKWSRIGAGIASELSASLARNDWLEVRQLDQLSESAPSGSYVLTGTISAAPNTLRLTAKLTDGDAGRILWSEVWNGTADDVFDIQSSLIERVEATISPGWTSLIALDRMDKAAASPRNLGAFDLYLRAIEQKHLFTPEALARSQRYLEQALELDPVYARAWTALAVVHLLQMESARTVDAFEDHLAHRIAATKHALRLSPADPETMIQSTFLYGRVVDHAAAEMVLRKAVDAGRNNPDILAQAPWAGARRVPVGAEAIDWARQAFALNPSPPPWYSAALATAASYAKDFELADDAYSKAPPITELLYRHAAAAAALGKLDKAADLLTRAQKQIPEGMTIADLEAADGNTFPAYVSQLTKLLDRVGQER